MGWKIKQLVEDVDTLYGSVQRRLVDEGARVYRRSIALRELSLAWKRSGCLRMLSKREPTFRSFSPLSSAVSAANGRINAASLDRAASGA